MADVSKIKASNGTTYNLKDIEGRKEENLVWGGTNKVGEVSPIGMSLSNEHSANRLAYINGASLAFEYSSNGGSTWADYGYTSAVKSQFCTLTYDVPIGRTDSSAQYSTSSRTRITLTAQNGTTSYVYTDPRKLLINISSSGGMQVLIEYRTGANYQSGGAWSTFGTYNLSGWSGWNDIPLILGTLGGGTSQTGNNWQLRLTFIMTSFSSAYPTTAHVRAVRLYGQNSWVTTSNLGATGHLYSYDNNQNATFPAQISASQFNGALNGNASTATKATQDESGNNIKATYANSFSISDHTITLKNKNGGSLGTVTVPDNNTTYTFANGTNGFTVTPSGGSAQTVTVTPSISNNVTGSGTSGYLTKFNGTNTITNGPALGSSTTTFLRNDGQWAVPSGSGSSGNKIFIVEPTPPYSVGDLWVVDDNNISVCVTARASGSFDDDDWGSAVDAVDADTLQTAIESAISDTITVVTGAGESGGNVMWRLNNNVPYELLITDTPTNITSNSAKIYRWDANGLRFSSTGYNGTYSTLINTSGQIPAQYLTGNLNAGVVAIQNFTAAMVHGGVLTRGKANNQDGTIEVYDANGTLIAEVSNLGLKIYGQGSGADRPYYLINTSGFIGYTKVNGTWTQTVKVAFDEFRMVKGYVGEELNIGGMIKIVPMTTSANSGIAFTAVT